MVFRRRKKKKSFGYRTKKQAQYKVKSLRQTRRGKNSYVRDNRHNSSSKRWLAIRKE